VYLYRAPTGEYAVTETKDIVRARQLPWRDWSKDPNLPALTAALDRWLQHTPAKCEPRCTCCKYVSGLNDAQVAYLAELFALGRAANLFRTGKGKTLAGLLAITVLEKLLGPQKAVLVTPASGRKKTMDEARDYARHWRVGAFTHVTYETLANPKNSLWFEQHAPTVVLLDEAHKAGRKTKAYGRLAKYVLAEVKAGRRVVVLPFTASISSRKLDECWHILRLAMGDACPLPSERAEAEVWAQATDEKVPIDAQVLPGALMSLAPPGFVFEDDRPRRRAQAAIGARLTGTAGIVATIEAVLPITLKLSSTRIELPPETEAVVAELRDKWRLPSGETFDHAWHVWRHSRSLGCGLYYRWDPPPPREWLEARRAHYAFIREYLSHSRKMDSPVHVVNGIDAGEIADGGLLEAWRAVRDTFQPHSKAEWVHTNTLEYAKRWLGDKENEHGICWVEYVAFGERLAAETGLPYFAAGAADQRGRSLNHFSGSPIIVSNKHREQFNLQWYNRNLITSCPPVGKDVDQKLGRTLREGQYADEVSAEFLLTTLETDLCLMQCFADAKRAQRWDGQPKKLCYGECMDADIQRLRDGDDLCTDNHSKTA
jgi:hypothetical protein